MSRDNGHERKADQSKEGDQKATTSAKVAAEGVTSEPQAERYEQNFTSFSGTADKKLHVQQFVLEDKEKGVQHTAKAGKKGAGGEVKGAAEREGESQRHSDHKGEVARDKDKDKDKAPPPRASFLAGLKKILDGASTPEEAAEKQGAFSIAYMMRKAQELFETATGKGHHSNQPDAAAPEKEPGVHVQRAEVVKSDRTESSSLPAGSAETLPPLTPQEVSAAVDSVKHVLNDWSLARLMNGGRPDVNNLANILQHLGKSQREQVDAAFRASTHGQGIESEGIAALNGDDEAIAHLHALMTSDDGAVDDAGLLARNFAKVENAGPRDGNLDLSTALGIVPGGQEMARVINAVSQGMNESQCATAESTILRTVLKLDQADLSAESPIGRLVRHEMQHNEHLSPVTKQAMETLLQGHDVLKSDKDQTAKLAELGLSAHRLDIFEDAMRVCPELRKNYQTQDAEDRIRAAFPDDLDFNTASDYAHWGHLGMATRMEGGAHFVNLNKETIDDAIRNAEPDEIALFKKGHDLWHTPFGQVTEDAPEAREYYERINLAMKRASFFDDQQIKRWEQTLRGEAPGIEETLKPLQINPLDNLLHNTAKAGATIEALANMTPGEQKHFREDKDFQQRMRDVVAQLRPGVEQNLANRVLDGFAKQQPVHLDSIDQIAIDHLKGVQPVHSLELFGNAAVEFRDRFKAVKTDEDQEEKAIAAGDEDSLAKKVIEDAVIKLVHGAGIADTEDNSIGKEYAKRFFETGHLTLVASWNVPGNERKIGDILNASADERAILMHDSISTTDIQLRDRVLGDGERKEFIRHLLAENEQREGGHADGKKVMHSFADLSPSDRVRAFIVGCGESQESLGAYLQGLSRAQISSMNADYAREYPGHLLSKDLTGKLPFEAHSQFVTLVSNYEVAPGEIANRAQSTHDQLSTITDGFTDHLWSGNKIDAQEQIDSMNDAIAKHGINLTYAQRTELQERLREYYKAESEFATDKAGAAKSVIDTSAALATTVVALLGAEVTVPFMLAAGAGGSVYSVGVTSVVEGKRFRWTDGELKAAAGHGFGAVATGILPVEAVGGKVFFVTDATAATVARNTLAKGGYGALRGDAEQVIARELQSISQLEATTTPRVTAERIAREVSASGSPNPQLVETLTQQLQVGVKQMGEGRLEVQKLFQNAYGNAANTAAANVIDGTSGFISQDQLADSLNSAVPQSALGGALMYKGFSVLGNVFKHEHVNVPTCARDASGQIYVGRGTVVNSGDTTFVVGDVPYALKHTDQVGLRPSLSRIEHDVVLPPSHAGEQIKPAAAISAEARLQSNKMATSGETHDVLQPGFTVAGKGRYISADGNISSPWAATVVDKANDPGLQRTLEDARGYMSQFEHLPPDQQATKLTQFVESKFSPTTLPGQSISSLADAEYTQFIAAHASKRVHLGEFIERGTGSCVQQATLLKFLGDELMPQAGFKLVTGNGADASNAVNHMWVQSGDHIFDPRQGTYGDLYSQRRNIYKASSEMPSEARLGLTRSPIEPGAPVALEGDSGWTVVRAGKDNTVIVKHDGAVAVDESDLLAANPGLRLKVGESVSLRNQDGTIDSGWHIRSRDQRTGELLLYKKDAITLEVQREQLFRQLPELVSSKLDKSDSSYKGLIESVSLLNAASRSAASRQELGLTQPQADRLNVLAIRLQKDAEKTKDWKEYKKILTEFNGQIDQLRECRISNPGAFIQDLEDLVHGRRKPVDIVEPVAPPPVALEEDQKVPGAEQPVSQPVDVPKAVEPPKVAEVAKPLKPFTLDFQGSSVGSASPVPTFHRELLSRRAADFSEALFATGLAQQYPDLNAEQPVWKWVCQLAAQRRDFGEPLVGNRAPDRRHLLELANALQKLDVSVTGKGIRYSDTALMIDVPNGTVIDGAPIPVDGTLKLQIYKEAIGARVPQNYDPPRLSAHEHVIKMRDGYAAQYYVQEKVQSVATAPEAVLEDVKMESAGEVFRDLPSRALPWGKDSSGRWCIVDGTLVQSAADGLADQLEKVGNIELLEKRLVASGQIRSDVSDLTPKKISSWLKEALVRPDEFHMHLGAKVNKSRLWALSKELEDVDILVTPDQIMAGGESIAVVMQPNPVNEEVLLFRGIPLPRGGVLKLTTPDNGFMDADTGTGERPWEARMEVFPTRVEFYGPRDSYIKPSYLYVQERVEAILDVDTNEVENMITQIRKANYELADSAEGQFGITADGRTVLIDYPAVMTASEKYLIEQQTDPSSIYGGN